MGITLSIDNLIAKDSLSCKPYEIRCAYVSLSRDGVITAQTLSEAQNEILKQSVTHYEIPTDVDCHKLLKTLQGDDVLKMFSDIYEGWIDDEKYNEEFKKQEAKGFDKNFYIRSPEYDDAYEADMTLRLVFKDFYLPEPEPEQKPELPAVESDFDDIKF